MSSDLLHLFHQSSLYFSKSISLAERSFADCADAFFCGVPTPSFNPLLLKKDLDDQGLNNAAAFFAHHQSPWCVVVPEYLQTPALETRLAHHGFFPGEKTLAMVLPLGHEPPEEKSESLIRLMNSQLEQWMLPLIEAFKSTMEVTEKYKNAHAHALAKHYKLAHLSLYKDGAPVSSLTLSWHDNIGRLDDIGTLPTHQRKGYARTLIKHALRGAYKINLTHCFLEASETGALVYQSLGFKPLFRNQIFSKR